MKKTTLFLLTLLTVPMFGQSPTSFTKVGDAAESEQEFFPGEHRARPVMGDYTNSGRMGLFSGGQDLGGSTGWYTDTRWGDLGDGTFANPVLNADYSDPDVVRVGNKYYMTCSEFHFMGMLILESDDMVNWRIVGRVFDRMDYTGYSSMTKYGDGTWAPSLTYHDGKFWIFVCSPNEGLFMTTATNPEGPWEPLYNVKNVSGWEDPAPLWDSDGNAYLGRSQLGGGAIILHKMSPDGKQLLDDGQTIYEGPVAEGTKMFIRDGYYYLSIPEGGVSTGWQQVLRSKNIYGPYEGKTVLEKGSTRVNGPHQGALVDTPDGDWWFYHFQSTEPQGRVMHLQPVEWRDGFPFIGSDYDGNGIGEPMKIVTKPAVGISQEPTAPQTDDNFDSETLALQWQFNHNPDTAYWSLTTRKGWLEINPKRTTKLRTAVNQFTQKTMGYYGQVTVKIDFSELATNCRAGILCIGNKHVGGGVIKTKSGGAEVVRLYTEIDGTRAQFDNITAATSDIVYIRLDIDAVKNSHQYSYSIDGVTFTNFGDTFESGSGDWKGSRIGLYSYTTSSSDGGSVFFDDFIYKTDGPGKLR